MSPSDSVTPEVPDDEALRNVVASVWSRLLPLQRMDSGVAASAPTQLCAQLTMHGPTQTIVSVETDAHGGQALARHMLAISGQSLVTQVDVEDALAEMLASVCEELANESPALRAPATVLPDVHSGAVAGAGPCLSSIAVTSDDSELTFSLHQAAATDLPHPFASNER